MSGESGILTPVPCWPWPLSPERRALFDAAAAALDLSNPVVPTPAVPSSPGHVLAFGSLPTHICSVAMIRPENVDSIESVKAALQAVLKEPEREIGDGPFFGQAAYMKTLLGATEITDPAELQYIRDRAEEDAMRRAMAA